MGERKMTKDYDILRSEVTDGLVRLAEGLSEEELKANADNIKIILGEAYETVIGILKKYLDIREEYYPLVTIWIIGTYIHNEFETYPYLFINAMRGSGKTRFLRLIEALSHNGELVSSLKEAVLFRDCKGKTLLIDEFESIMSKENQSLRELLNAGYKKGNKVKRMKRVRKEGKEDYEVETFDVYVPICMANIWGVEEVLADRCVTMILEKSNNPSILRYVERFKHIPEVFWVKKVFLNNLVQLCSFFDVGGVLDRWNSYVEKKYCQMNNIYTQTTLTTLTTQTTPNLEELKMFNKIDETGINGRNLELWMPLLLSAKMIGESVFDDLLKIAGTLTKEKKSEEMTESRDVMVYDFVSQQPFTNDFTSIKDLTYQFREFIGNQEGDDKWINDRWFGRALKRLKLDLDKRRLRHGVEIRLNISKAIEKMHIFKQEVKND